MTQAKNCFKLTFNAFQQSKCLKKMWTGDFYLSLTSGQYYLFIYLFISQFKLHAKTLIMKLITTLHANLGTSNSRANYSPLTLVL